MDKSEGKIDEIGTDGQLDSDHLHMLGNGNGNDADCSGGSGDRRENENVVENSLK